MYICTNVIQNIKVDAFLVFKIISRYKFVTQTFTADFFVLQRLLVLTAESFPFLVYWNSETYSVL